MRLIFHGTLRDLYGAQAVMQADTVADAVEGFSRQQESWPRDLMIDIVGFDTPEKLKDRADEIHLMPSMIGGGGKFGTILIGAALIGTAILTGGLSLTATGALASTTLGASLAVTGAVMILQGVMGLFMKAPKLKSVDDPEASKYIGINKNTTAVGTPITMAWGRIDLAGHWLSLQSDSTNLSYGVFPVNPS